MHILVTRRLTLRPLLEVDADGLAEGLSDLNVSRNLGPVPHPYTLDDALEHVRRPRRDGEMRYTVHRASLIGAVAASRQDDGNWHYGYWLGRAHWGQGYGTEAVPAFLTHLFAVADIDRLVSYVFADNPASLAIQKRLGAEVVGETARTSRARGCKVPGFDTVLTRAAFEKRFPPTGHSGSRQAA